MWEINHRKKIRKEIKIKMKADRGKRKWRKEKKMGINERKNKENNEKKEKK